MTVHHNHVTRDIRPIGQCPACDGYWAQQANKRPPKMLSIGLPSTLGNWQKMSTTFFGPDSDATKFIDEKIAEQSEDEEVIADEGQMIYLLTNLHIEGNKKAKEEKNNE